MGQKTKEEAQLCQAPATTCAAIDWITKRQDSFQYDTYGRLKEIDHTVPSGSKILYGYDAAGNLKTVQDENHTSANSTYGYDLANRTTLVLQTLAGAPARSGTCPAQSARPPSAASPAVR